MRFALPALLVLILAFHLATLRPGHYWDNGDTTMYVMEAQNIAEGQPYSQTKYIQNPYYFLAPQSYPPGFPLLLAPVVALFGVNVTAMKTLIVVFLVASLGVLTALFRRDLSQPALYALIAIIGLHPLLWEYKELILSDIPFLFFVCISLLLYQRSQERQRSEASWVGWAVVAGLCTGYALLTRTLGLALPLSFLGYDLIRRRRLSPTLLVVFGVCGALYGVFTYATALAAPPAEVEVATGGYAGLVEQDVTSKVGVMLHRVPLRLREYAAFAASFLDDGRFTVVSRGVFVLATILAGLGYGWRLLRRFSVIEVFCVVYAVALLPWSFIWLRYLYPLLPFYFFYVFVGFQQVQPYLGRWKRAAAVAGLLAVAVLLASKYTTFDYGAATAGIGSPASEAFFARVRAQTDPQDVFVTQHVRAFVFFTDRRASALQPTGDDRAMLQYMRSIGATYMVTGPRGKGLRTKHLLERRPSWFAPVFGNDVYQLYRIRYEEAAPEDETPEKESAVPSALSFSRKKPAVLAICASSSSAA